MNAESATFNFSMDHLNTTFAPPTDKEKMIHFGKVAYFVIMLTAVTIIIVILNCCCERNRRVFAVYRRERNQQVPPEAPAAPAAPVAAAVAGAAAAVAAPAAAAAALAAPRAAEQPQERAGPAFIEGFPLQAWGTPGRRQQPRRSVRDLVRPVPPVQPAARGRGRGRVVTRNLRTSSV